MLVLGQFIVIIKSMRDFLRFSLLKLAITSALVFLVVPFIEVDPYNLCVHMEGVSCSSPPVSSLFFVIENFNATGIAWFILLIGVITCYLIASLILTLSKRDFLITGGTILLQTCFLFLADFLHIHFSGWEVTIIIVGLLLLSLGGFWFFGKRKRTLFFTLILPAIFLYAPIIRSI